MTKPAQLFEIATAFSRLGCLSFGGPIAHLGYLRAEFVERRRWLEDADYADLVALCQFLPGPASSQVVFALGLRRAGLPGALLASLCFTLPSAVLLVGFAYGVARLGDLHRAGWLHGLRLAALAVVAQAVRGMGTKLCPDRARLSIALVGGSVLLLWPTALTQFAVLAVGGFVGVSLYRGERVVELVERDEARPNFGPAGVALATAGALLVVLPLLASLLDARSLHIFDAFYRTGALVFGGGHVVLPLLRAELVPSGWVDDSAFVAGYGAAQAIPGPLFAFAGYLGGLIDLGAPRFVSGLWCLFAIFLPGWLLVGGALPFWTRLRAKPGARAALAGTNAAVVGVLLAALYDPLFTESVRGARDLAVALVAFGLLELWKTPPLLVVLGLAATGQWLL